MADFDLSGLRDFMKKLETLQKALPQTNERITKRLGARLLSLTIKRTPVGVYPQETGKKGGTLRRGWTAKPVTTKGFACTVEIINPVEYGPYVEYGHRTANHKGWVPGHFMLTDSLEILKQQADAIIEKELERTFREVFG